MTFKPPSLPTAPCDDCLRDDRRYRSTSVGFALYCEHEGALAVLENERWRVVSPLTLDEAALALESMRLARDQWQERFPF